MIQVVYLNTAEFTGDDYHRLYHCACAQRQAKADSYRRLEDSLRCIAADALLQYAVFSELGSTQPAVAYAPLGKPYLENVPGFYFNLSHAGNWVAIAYGDREVGVDVAQISQGYKHLAAARRYFTAAERDYVFSEEAGQLRRFFEVWTAKESYLKFLGTGLSRGLSSFCVRDPQALGVQIHTRFPEADCCLSVCAAEEAITIRNLSVRQLMDSGCF